MADFHENNIEWLTEIPIATASFTQKRFVNRIKRLAEKDEAVNYKENADGSIVAHFPVAYVTIQPKRKVEMSEDRKDELRERLAKMRAPHA